MIGGGDQSQRSLKGEKAAEPESPKLRDTKKLIEFMESHYDEFVARVQSYHAIFQLMHRVSFCNLLQRFIIYTHTYLLDVLGSLAQNGTTKRGMESIPWSLGPSIFVLDFSLCMSVTLPVVAMGSRSDSLNGVSTPIYI